MPNSSSEELSLRDVAASSVVRTSRRPLPVLLAVLQSLRPLQWLKNILVFAPLAAAHRLGDLGLLMRAVYAFAAFSLCAAAIYLLNDLRDAPADRLHPHKRDRPIASGRLPRTLALVLVPLLLAAATVAVWPLGMQTGAAVAVYFALMIAYTLRLKDVALLDALVLAGGYALRVLVGALAVSVRPSARLLAFCIFLFFSLALVKRYAELALLRRRDGPATHARAYILEDQELIVALGTSCGALSVLVLALYMSSETAQRLYSRAGFIWLTCVLLLYWISYIWLMAHRGRMTDDPLVFAVRNPVSIVLIVLMGATAWLAV